MFMVDRDVPIAISAKTYRAGLPARRDGAIHLPVARERSDRALISSARTETC
jgi:hypothetical protein